VTDTVKRPIGFVDGNKTGDDYTYDANGSMSVDKNKDIASITYNYCTFQIK